MAASRSVVNELAQLIKEYRSHRRLLLNAFVAVNTLAPINVNLVNECADLIVNNKYISAIKTINLRVESSSILNKLAIMNISNSKALFLQPINCGNSVYYQAAHLTDNISPQIISLVNYSINTNLHDLNKMTFISHKMIKYTKLFNNKLVNNKSLDSIISAYKVCCAYKKVLNTITIVRPLHIQCNSFDKLELTQKYYIDNLNVILSNAIYIFELHSDNPITPGLRC